MQHKPIDYFIGGEASLASTRPSAARYFKSLQTNCREPMSKESMVSPHREGDMNQRSPLATSPSEKTAGQGSIHILSFQSNAKSAGAGLPSSDPKTIQRKLIIVAMGFRMIMCCISCHGPLRRNSGTNMAGTEERLPSQFYRGYKEQIFLRPTKESDTTSPVPLIFDSL